mmetsp:Transcript_14473/g.39612  ORF Transcript_14473/g.39612 Transcript_14473/m.39612 type:complete len:232 (-) Transcript_14473:1107-1802(-)
MPLPQENYEVCYNNLAAACEEVERQVVENFPPACRRANQKSMATHVPSSFALHGRPHTRAAQGQRGLTHGREGTAADALASRPLHKNDRHTFQGHSMGSCLDRQQQETLRRQWTKSALQDVKCQLRLQAAETRADPYQTRSETTPTKHPSGQRSMAMSALPEVELDRSRRTICSHLDLTHRVRWEAMSRATSQSRRLRRTDPLVSAPPSADTSRREAPSSRNAPRPLSSGH